MENKFKRIIKNLEEEETLTVGDQTFLNEMIFDKYIQCSIFGTITFFEVDFKRVLHREHFYKLRVQKLYI